MAKKTQQAGQRGTYSAYGRERRRAATEAPDRVSRTAPVRPIRVTSNPKKGASWTVIILLLVFFFPAGFIVMLSKLHSDRDHYISNGKGTEITGWVFLILFVFTLSGGGGAGYLLALLVLIVCCVLVILHGRTYKNYGYMVRKYLPVVSGAKSGNVEELARTLQTTYPVASANIQSLIDNGYLPGYGLDPDMHWLVIPREKKKETESTVHVKVHVTHDKETQDVPETRVVRCPHCGAMNRIGPGDGYECEYCKSPLA